jgi:hypothetical protein
MLFIIALLLITDMIAFLIYTRNDHQNEEWSEASCL